MTIWGVDKQQILEKNIKNYWRCYTKQMLKNQLSKNIESKWWFSFLENHSQHNTCFKKGASHLEH